MWLISYRINNKIKYNRVISFFPKIVTKLHSAMDKSDNYESISREFESCLHIKISSVSSLLKKTNTLPINKYTHLMNIFCQLFVESINLSLNVRLPVKPFLFSTTEEIIHVVISHDHACIQLFIRNVKKLYVCMHKKGIWTIMKIKYSILFYFGLSS